MPRQSHLTNWGFPSYQDIIMGRQDGMEDDSMKNIPEGFKKQEAGDYWKPEKGAVITGRVADVIEGSYGKQYAIKADDGTVVITPSHAMLQALLRDVRKGQEVIIECSGIGEAKPGQSPPYLYEVAVR